MLDLEDPRWGELEGGYRRPYDPRNALLRLEKDGDDKEAWSEFWDDLHHQGDVGLASYATVPHLIRIFKEQRRNQNFYSLITVIEVERHNGRNPALPDWLAAGYMEAMKDLLSIAAADLPREASKDFVEALLGAIAAAKGEFLRAELIGFFGDDELEEMRELYWKHGEGIVGNLSS